jgi:hypothetical protein
VTDAVIDLVPVCSGLENTTSESAGRIVGMGLQPGHFAEFGEITFTDRLDDANTKVRMIWEPEDPVRRDLRLFALLAAPGADMLPEGEWAWTTGCGSDHCAQLSLDGVEAAVLGFDDDGTAYSLASITEI